MAEHAEYCESCESSRLPEVGEVPHQPEHHTFPRRQFGKSKVVSRAFQGSWFKKWQWLHYQSTTDLAFCHTCVTAIKTGKMKIAGNVKDSAFIYNGFCNWKDATRCFRVKTYLRSTMTQLHFNNLLVLHVHKERTDTLQLTACLNEFVSGSEHRSSLFGTF